ncbi:MAG: hypothetical protein U0531_06720 [Dehalococcoidia bacterium]
MIRTRRALLQEAGVNPWPQAGDLHQQPASAGKPTADQAALVQEFWKRIGVNAEIKLVDSVALLGNYYSKKYDPQQIYAGVPISTGLDLDDFSYRVLKSGELANYINVTDPDLDKLLDAQQSEFDREKRKDIGRKIADRDLDQVYRLWVATRMY